MKPKLPPLRPQIIALTRKTFPRPIALAAMLFWIGLAWAVPASLARNSQHLRASASTRPNILVIQLDDQILSDLSARYLADTGVGRPGWWARLRWNWWGPPPRGDRWKPVLPNIQKLLIGGGVSFARYYASEPLCCPSRAALLTGRYAHNNSVQNNGGRDRGFRAFRRHDYRGNVAVWLQRAGYETIHVGKFLNGYRSKPPTPPPGWSDWQSLAADSSDIRYYGYTINSNGRITRPYGDRHYKHRDPTELPRPTLAVVQVRDRHADAQSRAGAWGSATTGSLLSAD